MPISAAEFAGVAPATPLTSTSEKPPVDARDDQSQTASPTSDEPYGVATSVTPAGIEVYYQAGPKRLYRVWDGESYDMPEELAGRPAGERSAPAFREVPSVSTILGVLDKSAALTWWGMKMGIAGLLELVTNGAVAWSGTGFRQYVAGLGPIGEDADVDLIVDLLTTHKLTVNHVRDKAGDRGTSVHTAFEQWAADQRITPQPSVFPETERAYALGLATFLKELTLGGPREIKAEVMVGSVEHGYAGRYDLRLELEHDVELTTKIYPKKAPVRKVFPAGRYLLDLKTSKRPYPTHALQLEGYEAASIECGYEPTDHRAVVHVTDDGRYELVPTSATIDEFLAVKGAYDATRREKEWLW